MRGHRNEGKACQGPPPPPAIHGQSQWTLERSAECGASALTQGVRPLGQIAEGERMESVGGPCQSVGAKNAMPSPDRQWNRFAVCGAPEAPSSLPRPPRRWVLPVAYNFMGGGGTRRAPAQRRSILPSCPFLTPPPSLLATIPPQ